MKRFVNPQIAPIGGFQFVDPDTGQVFRAATYTDLETQVQTYRQQNNLPRIPKFRVVWEHYSCENVPGMLSRCCDVADAVKRTFGQYFRGGKSYVRALLKGETAFVDQIVADRRAAICKQCDQNVVNYGHSNSQYYSDKFIKRQIGSRRSKFHDDLHTCKICSCILKAKVFYNDDIVAGSITDSELVQLTKKPKDTSGRHLKCWQLQALQSDLEKENSDA